MPIGDAVRVRWGLFAPAAEVLAANEAGVDVRGGFQGDAAVGREVEVQGRPGDAV